MRFFLTLVALVPTSALAADTSIHVSGTVLAECGTAHLGLAGYHEAEVCMQFSPGGAPSVQYDITNSGGVVRGYDAIFDHANITLVLEGETRTFDTATRFGTNYTDFGNWEFSGHGGDYAILYYQGVNGYVQ